MALPSKTLCICGLDDLGSSRELRVHLPNFPEADAAFVIEELVREEGVRLTLYLVVASAALVKDLRLYLLPPASEEHEG